MAGMLAGLAILVAAQGQSSASTVVAEGAQVEVCGRVSSFVANQPHHCDASMTVTTEEGLAMTVVVPASARRGISSGRELEGATACFKGPLETAGASTRIRIPSLAAVRVTRPAPDLAFGAGALDPCVADGLALPRLIHEQKPSYTSDAMRAGVEGVIELGAVIDEAGAVSKIRIERPLHPDLDEQAMKALQQWRFAPARQHGQAVPVVINVEMTFSLKPRR